MANQPQAQTIAQYFQQNKLPQWWNTPTQRFGQADVTGGVEEGTDFSVPLNTKIGSLTSGKVLYAGNGGYNDPSLGKIVQIQLSNGSILHYQHLNSTNLRVGQLIQPGTIIGQSGGQAGRFSSGPHIEVRYSGIYNPNAGVWSQKWVDPYTLLTSLTRANPAAAGAGAKTTSTTTSAGATTSTATSSATIPLTATSSTGFAQPAGIGASFTMPTISLAPTADVTQVLWTIDEVMQIIPPWNVINVQQDGIPALGLTFNDPISWIEGFLFNLGADAIAILLRAVLLVWGVFLGYAVLRSFIDVGAVRTSMQARLGV